MTILPKKKVQKDKAEGETLEPPPRSPPGENRVHSSRRATASPPPRWNSPAPLDERLAIPDPGGSMYEEPSTSHNKRRHRSSPHRTCRKHRHSERPIPAHNHPASWVEPASQISQGASTSHGTHTNHRAYRPVTTATASSQEHCVNEAAEEEEEEESYNSEDEYVPQQALKSAKSTSGSEPQTLEQLQELERCFESALKEKKGFTIKQMGEDGACMFRSVADQVYGDQEMHSTVRRLCADYMAKNADFYRQYVTEDFNTYLNRKRMDHCHGNHVEMQALSEIYNRRIEVYQYSTEPINTFHGTYKTDNEPIRLSYHGGVHYNSIIDPYKATIGVGLGLPGFQPGLAEKNLMREAMKTSEQGVLEHAMLEDKMRETDWELTQEAIDEQVARESYIQWLCDQEKHRNTNSTPRSASAACSSASGSGSRWDAMPNSPDSRKARSPRSNPSKSASNSAQNSPMRTSMVGIESSTSATTDQAGSPNPMLTGVSPSDISTNLPGGSASPKPSTSDLGAIGGVPFHSSETSSLMNNFNAAMYGLSDWDEDDIMTQIIAESQREYFNNLKKQQSTTTLPVTDNSTTSDHRHHYENHQPASIPSSSAALSAPCNASDASSSASTDNDVPMIISTSMPSSLSFIDVDRTEARGISATNTNPSALPTTMTTSSNSTLGLFSGALSSLPSPSHTARSGSEVLGDYYNSGLVAGRNGNASATSTATGDNLNNLNPYNDPNFHNS